MNENLALLGLDPAVLEFGQRALHANVGIAGVWSSDHNAALLESLRLGCCAYPDAQELVGRAQRVVFSQIPPGGLPADKPCLDLTSGVIPADWDKWLDRI